MNTENAILKGWNPREKRNETQIRIKAAESMKREIKPDTLVATLKKLVDSGKVNDLGITTIDSHYAHWYECLPPSKAKLVPKPKRRDKAEPCASC